MFHIKVRVSKEIVANMLCSAIEAGKTNGIGYWGYASMDESKRPPVLGDYGAEKLLQGWDREVWYIHWALFDGGSIVYVEHMDEDPGANPVTHTLDNAGIQRGLEVMAKEFPKAFGQVLLNDADGPLSDLFIQCCLFGEEKYA